MVKARKGGTEYIRSLLLGYDQEPPEDLDIRPGNYYNPYMSGQVIAMPPQLYEGIVEYADGTEATPEQMAHDVAAFLTWTAEPHMDARKRMGLMVMIYLLVLCGLLYWSYRQIWSKVEH
jgi:cytochrome c1